MLLALRAPILFVQGTRDPLCPIDLLDKVRLQMTAVNEQHVVQRGDHSLLVTKTQLKSVGESQDDVDHRVVAAIEEFLLTSALRSHW